MSIVVEAVAAFAVIVGASVLALVVIAATGGLESFETVTARLSEEEFYTRPWGFLLNNLSLAALVPVSMGTVWLVHRWRPRWLASVRPGVRWAWMLECAGWSMLWVGLLVAIGLVTDESVAWNPQRQFWVFVAVVVLTQPLQAAGEEYAFRGLLTQAVGSWFARAWLSAVVGGAVSATLFALAHGGQSPWLFADRFAFGVVASYLTWRTGGLEAGIALHSVNNLYAIGIALVTGTLAESVTATDYPPLAAVVDVVLMSLLALVITWRARRRDLQRLHEPAMQPGGIADAWAPVPSGAWGPYAVLAQPQPQPQPQQAAAPAPWSPPAGPRTGPPTGPPAGPPAAWGSASPPDDPWARERRDADGHGGA